MKDTVLNLTDLGFTVGAIAFMLNKTPVNIYAHLKSAGRMKDRAVVRRNVSALTPAAAAAVRKVYSQPVWLIGTGGTFRESEKKAA